MKKIYGVPRGIRLLIKKIFFLVYLFKTVSLLENQIHQVEINIMEVKHLRKKYRMIKSQLVDESVAFESILKKLEEQISKQENEISRLHVNERDAFYIKITYIFVVFVFN